MYILLICIFSALITLIVKLAVNSSSGEYLIRNARTLFICTFPRPEERDRACLSPFGTIIFILTMIALWLLLGPFLLIALIGDLINLIQNMAQNHKAKKGVPKATQPSSAPHTTPETPVVPAVLARPDPEKTQIIPVPQPKPSDSDNK